MKITLFTFLFLVASQSTLAEVRVGETSQVKLGENRRGLSAEAAHCKIAQLKMLGEQNKEAEKGSKAIRGQ